MSAKAIVRYQEELFREIEQHKAGTRLPSYIPFMIGDEGYALHPATVFFITPAAGRIAPFPSSNHSIGASHIQGRMFVVYDPGLMVTGRATDVRKNWLVAISLGVADAAALLVRPAMTSISPHKDELKPAGPNTPEWVESLCDVDNRAWRIPDMSRLLKLLQTEQPNRKRAI
jgi:chemotaxis signal transduction protein